VVPKAALDDALTERDRAAQSERQRLKEALESVRLNDASSEPLRKALLAWVDVFHTGPDGAEQDAFSTVVTTLLKVVLEADHG
jgi:hypothetical protein